MNPTPSYDDSGERRLRDIERSEREGDREARDTREVRDEPPLEDRRRIHGRRADDPERHELLSLLRDLRDEERKSSDAITRIERLPPATALSWQKWSAIIGSIVVLNGAVLWVGVDVIGPGAKFNRILDNQHQSIIRQDAIIAYVEKMNRQDAQEKYERCLAESDLPVRPPMPPNKSKEQCTLDFSRRLDQRVIIVPPTESGTSGTSSIRSFLVPRPAVAATR